MQSSPWLEFDGNPIVINAILNDTIGAANAITVYAKDAFNNTNSSTTFFTSYDGNSSYSETSTNTSSSGSPANFRMKWSSGNGLSGYIFSIDNCAGTFTNYTWTALSGNTNWTNVTNSINSNVGCIVRWRIFVNDSMGIWS